MNSLYVHFPFCKKRCFYCDFYSTTYGHDVMAAYVQALEKELRNRQYIKGTRVHTIYIGGGTPSLLPSKLLKELFCTIGRHFTIEQDAEITIEANPDDVTSEWLKGVAETPVNRISMGAQTFNDKLLGLIGRRHDGRQTVDAVSACREAGLRNISLDFIYGLPAIALLISNALYTFFTGMQEGTGYVSALSAAQFLVLALYAMVFVLEMTVNSYTKEEIEIIEGLPGEDRLVAAGFEFCFELF